MSLRTLLGAGTLITFGMVVGRVLGLLREVLLAAQFGTGSTADMAIILLIIPDLVAAAFIGGAFSAVLLPAFVSRQAERIEALLAQSLVAGGGMFLLIALACAFAFSGSADAAALVIAFCSIPLAAVTAVLTAYLQHRSRFRVPAFANAIFNAAVLVTLWAAPDNLVALSLGIMAASILRMAAHYAAFRKAGGALRLRRAPWEIDRRMMAAYAFAAGSGILTVLPIYLPYGVVAWMGGGLASFNYAFKLVVFPAVLIQTIVYMALLPWFVKLRADGDANRHASYSTSFQVAWAASLAVSMAVALGGHAIAQLCFHYGKMTAADIDAVGRMLAIGIWATPGMALMYMWQQLLYAHEQARPVFAASIVLGLSIIPAAGLGYRLAGEEGLLLGYALSHLPPIAIMARAARSRIGFAPWRWTAYLRIALACAAGFVPLALLYQVAGPEGAAGVVLAIGIGMVSLAAGLSQCPAARKLAYGFADHRLRLHR